MSIRIILALFAAAIPAASVVAAAPPATAPAPAEDLVPVAIDTAMGRIVIALDRGRAPKTVANFLAYVDGGKFNGETFYRAMKYGDGGLVQGGITSDARKLAKPVAFESTATTGIKHVAGTISMAASAPRSTSSRSTPRRPKIQQHNLAGPKRLEPRAAVDPIAHQWHFHTQQLRQALGDGRKRIFLRPLSFLGSSEMRSHHHPRVGIDRLSDAGDRGADAGVIGYVALVILRNVQIGAYDYPFSGKRRVGEPSESHGRSALRRNRRDFRRSAC